MKQKITFLRGYPSAGKTTFAQRFIKENPEYVLVSADEVRKSMYGSQDKYGDSKEVYQTILFEIQNHLNNGVSVLYDAANLNRSYREDFIKDIQFPANIEKNIITIPTCQEVCIERHFARMIDRKIPIEKIMPYFDINELPYPKEGWDNIWTACSTAYIASPFFEPTDRENAIKAAEIMRAKGIETYLPLEHKIKDAWDLPNYQWGEEVFKADIRAINRADTVIVLSYGRIASAGTSWEAGYAYGIGKRVIIVEMPGVNLMSLMIANGRYATIHGLEGLKDYDFVRMPRIFDNEMEQK